MIVTPALQRPGLYAAPNDRHTVAGVERVR